jgi:endonuclease/exonuclease/phosphatase (EEP) superfamily protein YafD
MGSPNSSRPAAPTPQVGRGRRLLTGFLWLCAWSYLAVALGLWALLQWADLWWPASLFLFAPRSLCLLPLLVFLPAVWRLRRNGLLVPLGLAAVVIAGPVMGLCIPWRTLLSSTPSGPRLRVLSCNLHGSKAVVPHRLEALVQESGVDVVALQEWPEAEASALGTWPGWYRHATPRLFLASQFPIRRVTELGLGPSGLDFPVSRYDLETPAGMVHFFSLHLASPRDAIHETIHQNHQGPAEVSANSAQRRQQSEFVARHANGLRGPVLLAGDFNTPPESVLFRQVWSDYSDAFRTAGWGWGYTFAGGKTLVRIDHILAGKGWHCGRCWVGPHVGSPHRPVLAELIWSGATEEEPTAGVRRGP